MPDEARASIKVQPYVTKEMRARGPTPNDAGRENEIDLSLFVRTIVAERFCRPLDTIKPDTRLIVDLGLDSLDMIEINIALEERLHLPLPQVTSPDEIAIETVQHLTDLVIARVAGHRAERRAGP